MPTKAILGAVLCLAAIVGMQLFVPPAIAATPSLLCSYTLQHPVNQDATIGNSAFTGAPTFFTEGVQPQDGSIAFTTRIPHIAPDTSIDAVTTRLTSACGVAWTNKVTCAPVTNGVSNYCLRSGPIADQAGHFTSLLLNVLSPSNIVNDNYVHLSANTGNTLNPTAPYNTVPNNPAPGTFTAPANPTGGATYTLGTPASIFTIVTNPDPSAGANKVQVYGDTAWQWSTTSSGQPPYTVTTKTDGSFAYVTGWSSGAGSDTKLFNLNTHVQVATNQAGDDAARQLVDRTPPRQGQGALAAKVFSVHGLTNSATLVYDRLDLALWTKDVANQALTGFGSQYDARGWDLDGSNNLLICGKDSTAGANNLGYVAKGDTTANTFTTILSIPQPASFQAGSAFQTDACRFDAQGGFWTISDGQCQNVNFATCYLIQRWGTSGFFANPTGPPNQSSLYPNPDCSTTSCATSSTSYSAGVPQDAGFLGFAQSVGFASSPGSFLFGLILASITFLIVASVYHAVSKHRAGTPWAGASLSLGVMVFNSFTGIWNVWVTIVMVVMTCSFIGALRRYGLFQDAKALELMEGLQ